MRAAAASQMSRTTPLTSSGSFAKLSMTSCASSHVTVGTDASAYASANDSRTPNALHDLAAPELLIDSLTHRRNSFVEVADAEALTCRTKLHHWQVDPDVPLL